jgi:tripartite-type tricarboxylate transporter receptor subunit TctC
MKLPRRRQFLHLAAGAAALPILPRVAWAQAYPTRPVRIVVGAAPSGTYDIMARLIGEWLSERLGQPFVIENRPGAGTTIGTEAVVKAPPDGYTLLLVGAAAVTSALLYDKLNFNLIRDIAPVAAISREPHIMVVNPSVPASTVPEFIAYAKGNPGKISMASGDIGTVGHLSVLRFPSRRAGAPVEPTPAMISSWVRELSSWALDDSHVSADCISAVYSAMVRAHLERTCKRKR